MIVLRNDQQRWIRDIYEAFNTGHESVMAQAPTAFGKTTSVGAGIVLPSLARGRTFRIVAHLEEITDDIAESFREMGIPCGMVKAGRAADPSAPVQVCSTMTLAGIIDRGEPLAPVDRLIVDEAHRGAAPSNRAIIDWHRAVGARVLGLSASPCRSDGRALDGFQALVLGPTPRELIDRGAIVRAQVFAPADADGTLAEDPVDVVLRPDVRARRVVVFAADKRHALDVAARCTGAGYVMEALIEGTPAETRRTMRARLASGETRGIVTVRAVLEGFNAPVLDTAILCKTFGSLSAWLQAKGRVGRAYPGKSTAWVFDLCGAFWLHGDPDADRPWSLDGKQGAPAADPRLTTRRCPECDALFEGDKTVCPREGCGAVLVAHELAIKVRRREMFATSTIPPEERESKYRAGIERRLLSQGKSAWVAAKIAADARLPWAPEKSAEGDHAA